MTEASIAFWSWNDKLEKEELKRQIRWMKNCGIGGFFMHARGGLKTEYLSAEWFEAVKFCIEEAEKVGLEAWAYDENDWPSGFCGGKLLNNKEYRALYLTAEYGEYDEKAFVSYVKDGEVYKRRGGNVNGECINLYLHYHDGLCDVANPRAVDAFIDSTYKKYKRHSLKVKGFFTDEPQYCCFQTPYTHFVEKYFVENYGENVLDGLYLLFDENGDFRDFRYKYYKALQTLMLNNYARRIYNYCDKNGNEFTGHYIQETSLVGQMQCCMGIMPFYEYQHMCGVDWLGNVVGNSVVFRQLASVAAQTGKKNRICETYGCTGWDATPAELKRIGEFQFLHGVNVMCQHLIPYSESGERKRDYPEHFSPFNGWVKKGFKEFNGYFNKLREILVNSEEIVETAVFHPIRSAYFYFKDCDDSGGKGIGELESSFSSLTEKLDSAHIPFHYIDETILGERGKAENGVLRVGEARYTTLIFPKIYTMDASSERLVKEFAESGGKVWLYDGKPTYKESKPYSYDYLESNVGLSDIVRALPYKTAEDKDVAVSYRKAADGKKFLHVLNTGKEKEFTVKAEGYAGVMRLDVATGESYFSRGEVRLKEYESAILYFTEEKLSEREKLTPVFADGEYEVIEFGGNYLTLDTAEYSFDGEKYSEKKNVRLIFDELLKLRYDGELYLKYSFVSDIVPDKISVISEDDEVYLGGKKLVKSGVSALGKGFGEYPASGVVKVGVNDIVVKKYYCQSDDVYKALFELNAPALRHKLLYDSFVESVYLYGNFAVDGDFSKGEADNAVRGKNFRLTTVKPKIRSLIEDGFPFFAGDITLKTVIYVDDTKREFRINRKFCIADIKVNGRYAGRLMFTDGLDVSEFLKKGENEIEITFITGNRNLLGPFHGSVDNVMPLHPVSWSELKREDYSFIKTEI